MILRKKIILCLAFLFLFYSFFKPCFSVDDILEIKISDLETTLEVLQGKCNTAPFHVMNRYNETVNVYYRIDSPSDMVINSYPKDYTLLEPGAIIAGNLNVCVNEHFENETYKIKFWLESLTKVNESRVRSDGYDLEVKVLYNPELETTTSTSIETTTVKNQIITTIPTYTTIYTTTTKKTDKDTNNFKIGNLIDRKQLVTIGVIIILLILIIIPYLTFTRIKKME